jgi:RimJ/RimL family protein N-acetyltransferase
MESKTYKLNDGREVRLRPFESTDKEGLLELSGSMSESALRWTKMPSGEEIEQSIQFPDYYIGLVTEHDDRIIGHGEIKKDAEKRDGELNIHLHQDYHGVGLGTVMMIVLMNEATAQGIYNVNLQVAAENIKAVRLFRKFGFQQRGITRETVRGKEHDAYLMSKALKA